MSRFQVANIAAVAAQRVGDFGDLPLRELNWDNSLPVLASEKTYNCYNPDNYAAVKDVKGAVVAGDLNLGASFYFAKVEDGSDVAAMELNVEGGCGMVTNTRGPEQQRAHPAGSFFMNYVDVSSPQPGPEGLQKISKREGKWHSAEDTGAKQNLCVFTGVSGDGTEDSTTPAWFISNANVTRGMVEESEDCTKQEAVFDNEFGGALFWCKIPEEYMCILWTADMANDTTTVAPTTTEACDGSEEDLTTEEDVSPDGPPNPDHEDSAAALALTAVAAMLMA